MSGGAAVLIVNHDGGDALLRALDSLARSDASDLPILLVDNASGDVSLSRVRERFPKVEIVRRTTNDGFAAGVNAGLRELLARGHDAVAILNPDVEVGTVFLTPLRETVRKGAALAGPKVLFAGEPPRIESAGGRVTFGLNLGRLRGRLTRDDGRYDEPEDVEFLPGTAWLLSSEAVEKVGWLDEGFFMYFEDFDYCLRVREAGLRIRYEPRSVVVHLGSHSSGGGYTPFRKYWMAYGSWRVMRKHGSPGRWLTFLALDVATAPLALGYGLLRGRPGAAVWKLRGLLDGLRGVPLGKARERWPASRG